MRPTPAWTGVVLWRRPDDLQLAWQEISRVQFRQLSESQLDGYLATRTWQGCSGAYAILENDDPYVTLVEGSMTNVIGLPMETLSKVVRARSVSDGGDLPPVANAPGSDNYFFPT